MTLVPRWMAFLFHGEHYIRQIKYIENIAVYT